MLLIKETVSFWAGFVEGYSSTQVSAGARCLQCLHLDCAALVDLELRISAVKLRLAAKP